MNRPSAEPQEPAVDAPKGGLDVSYCRVDATGAMKTLLRYLPVSLAVHEIMRMRALAEVGVLRTPLLDVGCGDGLFWEVLVRDIAEGRTNSVEGLVGIDINRHELELASLRLSPLGGELKRVDITDDREQRQLDDRLASFRTVIANCSLEHVPRLEVALTNIKRYMAPDGELWLFVPAPGWSDSYRLKKFLRLFSARLAGAYGGLWDGFYQHHHLYRGYVWRYLLEGVGFHAEIRAIGSARANVLRELWLPPALLSFLYKCVFKHYPERVVAPLKHLCLPQMRGFLEEVQNGAVVHDRLDDPDVVEYAIRCTIAR